MTTAFGHFVSQKRQGFCRLMEEILGWFHDQSVRVAGPLRRDAPIDRCRFLDRFQPQRIVVIVGVGRRRRAQVDDGVIPCQLDRACSAHR